MRITLLTAMFTATAILLAGCGLFDSSIGDLIPQRRPAVNPDTTPEATPVAPGQSGRTPTNTTPDARTFRNGFAAATIGAPVSGTITQENRMDIWRMTKDDDAAVRVSVIPQGPYPIEDARVSVFTVLGYEVAARIGSPGVSVIVSNLDKGIYHVVVQGMKRSLGNYKLRIDRVMPTRSTLSERR